jgi:hypothetical protein
MGIDLVAKGADFSANAIGYEAPVTRGLRYWGFIGGGTSSDATARATRMKKNWLSGGANAALIGAVSVNDYFASGFKSGANYLDTGIAEEDSQTLLLVSRVPGATASNPTTDLSANASRPMMAGNGGSTALPGWNLYYSSTPGLPQGTLSFTYYVDASGTVTQVSSTTLTVPDVTAWKCHAAVIESGVGSRVRGLTSGTNTGVKAEARTRVKGATPIRIGAGGRSDFAGLHDIAFAALYGVALTDAEIDTVYAAVKSYLAARPTPIAI